MLSRQMIPGREIVEQRFAYDETPDQLSSAAEIKDDMQPTGRWTACCAAMLASARPRLRCVP